MAKILVIDDDVDILELCKTLLKLQGHEVLTSYKASEALSDVSPDIDLLIVDINMPDFTGFELLDVIKTLGVFHGPILMMSARQERSDILKALELGARDYILKPMDRDVFLRKVQALLGRRVMRSR